MPSLSADCYCFNVSNSISLPSICLIIDAFWGFTFSYYQEKNIIISLECLTNCLKSLNLWNEKFHYFHLKQTKYSWTQLEFSFSCLINYPFSAYRYKHFQLSSLCSCSKTISNWKAHIYSPFLLYQMIQTWI